MKNNRLPRIISQGALDGACLLYATINAYKSLSSSETNLDEFIELHEGKWEQVVAITPSLQNFFNGKGSSFGSPTDKEEEHKTANLISNILMVLSGDAEHFGVNKIAVKDIRTSDYSRSVVIACYCSGNGVQSTLNDTKISDHWVCIVGHGRKYMYVQCSHTIHVSKAYKENFDKKTKRFYNGKISCKQLVSKYIVPNYVYLISNGNSN